ncbi:hypothetical protein F4782DRAFT_527198 [Xylaria castorea]|nr:hypothetical protein F4782DRAFT_527198 [Xylaria castorea]
MGVLVADLFFGDAYTGIDILVNAAGAMDYAPLHETEFSSWRRTMDVDLDGVMLGMRSMAAVAQPTRNTAITYAPDAMPRERHPPRRRRDAHGDEAVRGIQLGRRRTHAPGADGNRERDREVCFIHGER